MSEQSVKFVTMTPNAEESMAYIARVSNPSNQNNTNYAKLLQYCIKHNHWSVFEQAYMTLEINTTRGIAAQILRHRSFTYQEFSQRYADTNLLTEKILAPELRRQDTKNRQNSIDDLDPEFVKLMTDKINTYFEQGVSLYNHLLANGVAKESARFVLPLATPTKIYMTGSCRSWVHYIQLRTANGTQKEHMEIAKQARCIFSCKFPAVSEALAWINECDCTEYQPAVLIRS